VWGVEVDYMLTQSMNHIVKRMQIKTRQTEDTLKINRRHSNEMKNCNETEINLHSKDKPKQEYHFTT